MPWPTRQWRSARRWLREEAFPEDVWHERAAGGASGADRVTFIAERDGQWVEPSDGPLQRTQTSQTRESPLLVGMFVEPVERGRGLRCCPRSGSGCLGNEARGATSLYLWVTATNDSAIALYDKCSFRPTGNQRPVGHSPSLAEIRMVRDLSMTARLGRLAALSGACAREEQRLENDRAA